MKTFVQFSLAATLAAGAAAHGHGHEHLHARKHAGSPVEKRDPDPAVKWVVGPTKVVYELDGKIVNAADAKEGLSKGEYVVVSETTPTFTPPPPPPPPTTSSAPPTTSAVGDQFFESKASSPPPKPTTSSAPPPPPPPPKSAPASNADSTSSGGTGLTADFPSGTIKCSEFPVEYGAVPLPYLGLGGWSGIQFVPGYSPPASTIVDIITGVSGQDCSANAMCAYACPAGYQKAQYPKAQGSTKESIGGLWCNPDGFLELTREGVSTLCMAGEGGVTIQNDLTEEVCTCRTDYPGTESMTIPLCAAPGASVPVCNPDQATYYEWSGLDTSAQYYINPKGLSAEDSCLWTSPTDPTSAGNWSPLILGVGKASDGITFISIFQNLPTSNAKLDFNVEIKGGNTECSYINGQWTGGATGCTTGVANGGSAIVRYF